MSVRKGAFERSTKETVISVSIQLGSAGESRIDSGVPFFDHMISSFSKHGMMELVLSCKGDTHIDDHHSVEDIGIVMGKAFALALGDKKGISRFGFASVPMDDSLCQVSVDLSGRPYFRYEGVKLEGKINRYDEELTNEFLYAFSTNSGANIHVNLLYGENRHHIHEAIYKALGLALRNAYTIDPMRAGEIPSTKGTL
ncbi:MAG TPA: imidazoleglycerol-phosphate dehydratase HisB [Spirochaetota bacterium]|nr:imidazoleglycerol-phosphate dehydratase HisB [Spirochaetota bacterium]